MESIAWVNGVITSLADARVSFLDRGYLFGDGVYEAMKVVDGRIFALPNHLDRLERSMEAIRIRPDWARAELERTIQELVARSGLSAALIYMQVTRGVAPRQHAFSPDLTPTLAIFVSDPHPVAPETREKGVKAITVADERWAHPHIKTLNLLPNVLARQEAAEQGAYEAIFIRDGRLVTECSSSNVFAVIDDLIVTPPTDGRILPGVTRDLLLTAAREANYPVREDYITLEELRGAGEIFITSTGVEALGVVDLDGQPVGDGAPGRITGELYRLFVSRWFV
ncbi:MAG: D-amino acid aminotransferase [Thermacetogeniaceae bacterium]